MILTDGSRPIHAIDRAGASFSLAPPHVQPVDTTGAGDVFRAGLIYGLLHGRPLPESVAFGAAAGALKITRLGGEGPIATVEEVARLAAGLKPVAM